MWRVGNRPLPRDVTIDGGSDWIVLNRNYSRHLATDRSHYLTELKHYYKYSLLPAEVTCLSACLSVSLLVYPSCLPVFLSLCWSIHLVCLSICLSCQFVLSVCLIHCLFCQSFSLSVGLSILFTCLSVCWSVYLFVCLLSVFHKTCFIRKCLCVYSL